MTVSAHFILYVANQAVSTRFYALALNRTPQLDVPGMTEFDLGGGAVLGLMPEAGIRRLLGDAWPNPASPGAGGPRAELYLYVDDVALSHQRALAAGATPLSAPAARGWGAQVAYSLDPDGHVLAFAKMLQST